MKKLIVPVEVIERRIYFIRGQKVMLDKDLAELYKVNTKSLNQAVKRNKKRFPGDFMFQLNEKEKNEVVTNCDHLQELKYSYQLPYVFNEQGVAMLSSILNSDRAIAVNIAIMRTFVRIRQFIVNHRALAQKFDLLEKRVIKYISKNDIEVQTIFSVLKKLMCIPVRPTKRIGFLADR